MLKLKLTDHPKELLYHYFLGLISIITPIKILIINLNYFSRLSYITLSHRILRDPSVKIWKMHSLKPLTNFLNLLLSLPIFPCCRSPLSPQDRRVIWKPNFLEFRPFENRNFQIIRCCKDLVAPSPGVCTGCCPEFAAVVVSLDLCYVGLFGSHFSFLVDYCFSLWGCFIFLFVLWFMAVVWLFKVCFFIFIFQCTMALPL